MKRRLSSSSLLVVVMAMWGGLLPAGLAAQAGEQATLTGTIVDAETEAPLAGVHVFIATSMIGTTTDRKGAFRLENVPLGAHRLVLSMVGYLSETHDVLLRAAVVAPIQFQLRPDVIEVGEVTVTAMHNRRWRRDLKKFMRLLVGETPNAKHVEILNPEVLDFDTQQGRFTATAMVPLTLENRALGYRLQYFLHRFVAEGDRTWQDGECLFEPLIPENEAEAARWEKNRRTAFRGSPRHFLLTLLDNTSTQAGFVAYHVSTFSPSNRTREPHFIVNPHDYVTAGATRREHVLAFTEYLEVIYTGEREHLSYLKWQGLDRAREHQRSWIHLADSSVVFDAHGSVLNPYGVIYFGYMSFERLADLLPKEYRPL